MGWNNICQLVLSSFIHTEEMLSDTHVQYFEWAEKKE